MRENIVHARVKAERTSATRRQLGAGDRIPTGKERHFVAAPHKLFGQVRNDPLSSAIETRRNALNQGGDLGDLHVYEIPNALILSTTQFPAKTEAANQGSLGGFENPRINVTAFQALESLTLKTFIGGRHAH